MKVVRRVVTDTLLGNSFAPEDLGLSDLQIAKIFVHGEMDGVLEPEFWLEFVLLRPFLSAAQAEVLFGRDRYQEPRVIGELEVLLAHDESLLVPLWYEYQYESREENISVVMARFEDAVLPTLDMSELQSLETRLHEWVDTGLPASLRDDFKRALIGYAVDVGERPVVS